MCIVTYPQYIYSSLGRGNIRAPAGPLHGDHEAQHRRLRGATRQAVRGQEQPHRRAMNARRPHRAHTLVSLPHTVI